VEQSVIIHNKQRHISVNSTFIHVVKIV